MKPAAKARATGRTASSVRTSAKAAAKPRAAAPAPKLTMQEMRGQLEKLTKANASLRAKNRDLTKSTKTAATTISALQEQITALEGRLASHVTPTKPEPKPRRARSTPGKPTAGSPPPEPAEDNEPPHEAAVVRSHVTDVAEPTDEDWPHKDWS